MKKYDYVVIGGGVAGLYFAYCLEKRGIQQVCILEKTEHVGGRNVVHDFHGKTVSLGPGAFRETDKHVLALVKELKIPITVFEQTYDYNIPNYEPCWYNRIIRNWKGKRGTSTDAYLMKLFHGNKFLYKKFKKYSFYSDFFHDNDSYYAIKHYPPRDLYHNASPRKMFLTKPDIHEIIRVLQRKLSKKIHLHSEVYRVERTSKGWLIHIHPQECVFAKNLVIATEYTGIRKIIFEPPMESIECIRKYIGTNPFLRWYTYHKQVNVPRPILTDTIHKKVIPIDNHIMMSGYADNEDAIKLKRYLEKKSTAEHLKSLRKSIGSNGTVSAIRDSFYKFWNVGTHYFKVGYDKCQQKDYIHEKNFYLVGEIISKNQGWTEGALESVNHALGNHIE